MRLSSLVYFYRLRLRIRWVQELFALIGIAVGVALLFVAQVTTTSLNGSVEQLVKGTFGNADLQLSARDPHGFDQAMTARVRNIDGVSVAAPLLEVRANLVGPNGRRSVTLLGADRNLARLQGPLLSEFRDAPLPATRALGLPSPIVRAIGAPLGARLNVEIGAGTVRSRLGAALSSREIGALVDSPVAVGSLPYIQSLSGNRGRVTRVIVASAPGRSGDVRRGLERLAGSTLSARSADYDLRVFREAAAPTNQSTALFAAISALVGFLFAFNAMLLTLSDRRLVVADLKVDGYPPRSILQVVLFDALMLAVVASALGLLLGDQLSRHLFDQSPGYLSFAFPVGDQRIVSWRDIAIAAGGGMAATLLAALVPLADLLWRGPSQRGGTKRRNTPRTTYVLLGAGLACLASSSITLVMAPGAALFGIGTLIVAFVLLLPAILWLTLNLVERALSPVKSAIPLISIGELKSRSARSIALCATGGLAVLGSVAIQGARDDLQQGLDSATRDLNGIADVWASPSGGPNAFATTPFDDRAKQKLQDAPSVGEVRTYRAGFLDLGSRRVWVIAPPREASEPIPPSQLRKGDLALATKRLRGHGWAVVSDGVAAERGLRIGDGFTLPSPRPTHFRVAALSSNIGWAPGAVIINASDYGRAWATSDPTALQVLLKPHVTPEQGRRDVARALDAGAAVTVETSRQREHRHFVASRQGLSRLSDLALLVQLAAVLAMGAAMGGMIWQRRVRLASLKLDGFDDGTVWRALLLESFLLLGTGCIAGGIFGLYGQQLLDRALGTVTGFPIDQSVGLQIAVASVAVVTAVAVVLAALPGYLAARVSTALALQD
jgi:putative ABC transport system permease protein